MGVSDTRFRRQSPNLIALLQSFSKNISIVVALIGCSVILGWIKDITFLKSVLPGWVPMRPNTAIGLLFAGTSLRLCQWQPTSRITRRATQAFAVLVFLIGLLTLIEYSFNLDLGIDQLLLTTTIDKVGDVAPGRMAVHVAVTFVLLGLSLLLLSQECPKYLIAHFYAVVIFLIAFFSLLGYVYGNAYFYRLGSLTSIAIHTASAFLLLSCGILFAHPDRGLMVAIASSNTGGIMGRRLLIAEIVFPPVVYWLTLFGYRSQFYTAELGLCLLSILNVFIFAVIIWWNSRFLNVVDYQRRRVETSLKQANEELEQRVSLCTCELSTAMEQLQEEIAERKRMEKALFQEKEVALVTLQSIGDAVITTDATSLIKYLNPAAEALTGWSLSEALGLPIAQIFRIFHEITRESLENPVEKALRSGSIVNAANHSILITRNGNELSIDDSATPIRTLEGKIIGAVMVFHDTSKTRSMERLLSWQASHDALTELMNRREFENHLEKVVASARKCNEQHALFYLDLDQFKIVNDTCGHIAGDEFLRQVSILCQTYLRSSDILARLGGDEFGILLNHCPLEPAMWIANNLREVIQKFRFVWEDTTFNIGVSIGLAIVNADTQSMNSVLIAADAACHVAKNNGRNRVHVYQADDIELARQHGEMQWVTRINQALEDNRFRLYSQSIVPVNQTKLLEEHYEVLLRLIDETGNLVSPSAFLPAAERYNLMQTIDRWVIHTVFTNLRQQGGSQHRDCLYAINISGVSINDDQFTDFVQAQFALHQIPPKTICFEITETVAIANLGKAASFIHSLRELGCRFALDDFGSGMSSFAYLKNLPVDYLKIDGGFVKSIVEDAIDFAMVEAINQIGHVMGIQTIAEFVEDDAILEKIKALGVDYAQGYGIAKPRPF